MDDNRGIPCFPLAEEPKDNEDENEEDWSSSYMNQTKRSSTDLSDSGYLHLSPAPAKKKLRVQPVLSAFSETSSSAKPSNDVLSSVKGHKRTIIHIDIDCFYAQVEMILNPSLHNQPLGIQQKHIVVTCNYVARALGLTKLMRLSDAKKKCPDLVLVNGEDLSKYREFSKRVNDLLLGLNPCVERLGFDENFLDVTGLVEARLKENIDDNTLNPVGFVYGDKHSLEETKVDGPHKGQLCTCGCHQRLIIGSHLASEIRQQIFDKTGLTCCAGIAHNKILAKLAGECHKPNKQTVLFPEDVNTFMQSLPARKIPGVGSSSAKRLQSIGVNSVQELQLCSMESIKAEFGDIPLALTLKRLSYGIDDTDVIPSGNPKSISEEDTYYECSTITEVTKKLKGLNDNLVSRLTSDLGFPQTVRLTIRHGIGELAGDRRESRQCPMPSRFTSPGLTKDQKQEIILSVTLGLFKKLVNIKQPFQIKLINVCLTKFQKPAKGVKTGVNSFFSSHQTKSKSTVSSLNGNSTHESMAKAITESQSSANLEENNCEEPIHGRGCGPLDKLSGPSQHADTKTFSTTCESIRKVDIVVNKAVIPSDIDTEVFNSLPAEVQRELMEHWKLKQKSSSLKQPLKTTVGEGKKTQKQPSSTGLLKYFSKS